MKQVSESGAEDGGAKLRFVTTCSARRTVARLGRVPMVDAEVGTPLSVEVDARDVSIALSRPMDVSITNRLPGAIVAVERLAAPYARVTFDLGSVRLDALVTWESVERLALEEGLRAWAMIKTVAIDKDAIKSVDIPAPRPWPPAKAD
jgi:molybdate transport system ATP-binding protein